MNKTIKIEDLKEYDGAWYRKDKDGLCDIFTMVDLKELLAQQKEKIIGEIFKILEKVIEEEYGEGEEITRRIVVAFRNQTLIKKL